jgi:hypothetical protein
MTKAMTTKVIIDFHPLVYAMTASIEPLTNHPSFQSESSDRQTEILFSVVETNIRLVTSLAFMGDRRPSEYQIIFVTDKKVNGKYWRHDFLLDETVIAYRQVMIDSAYAEKCAAIDAQRVEGVKGLRKPSKPKQAEPIVYKGGRKQVSELHTNIISIMRTVIKDRGYTMLGIGNYEADDIAAALVRLNAGRSYTWLITIDTDWLGLVNDSVGWCCQKGYEPRFRDNMQQVNEWSERRLRTTFNEARELWDYKSEVGDKSDNLPAFSPLAVIDLCQPPLEFDILHKKEYVEHLEKVLQSPGSDAHFVLDGATRKLAILGLTPIIPILT